MRSFSFLPSSPIASSFVYRESSLQLIGPDQSVLVCPCECVLTTFGVCVAGGDLLWDFTQEMVLTGCSATLSPTKDLIVLVCQCAVALLFVGLSEV